MYFTSDAEFFLRLQFESETKDTVSFKTLPKRSLTKPIKHEFFLPKYQ